MLHKKELADRSITCTILVEPEHFEDLCDKHMIEQVLINLIKNAIQASMSRMTNILPSMLTPTKKAGS